MSHLRPDIGPPPDLEGVSHEWVATPELEVHVATAGDPASPPLLLLHGWPQHWYEWNQVIAPLAEAGHRVLAPDLRGFGWSGAPDRPYGPETFALDQIALLDALGIERAHVAGHDWGGFTTLVLACLHRERLWTATAFNTPHPWPRISPRLLPQTWRSWYAAANAWAPSAAAKRGSARWVISHGHGRNPFSPEEEALYTDQFVTPTGARTTAKLYRDYFRLFSRAAFGGIDADRVGCPTQLVFGEDDLFISDRLAEPPSGDRGPFEVEMVPGAGHFIVNEMPDLATDRILSHIRKATHEPA